MSTYSFNNPNNNKQSRTDGKDSGFSKDRSSIFENNAVKNPVPGKGEGGKKNK